MKFKDLDYKKVIVIIFLLSIFLAVFLSPFASSFPDGLEKVAERNGFIIKERDMNFFSMFKDYNFKFIKNDFFSIGFSGLIGTILVFGLTYFVLRLIIRK